VPDCPSAFVRFNTGHGLDPVVTDTTTGSLRAAFAGEKARFQALFFVHYAAFSGFAVFRNVYLEEMGMSGSAMGQIGFLMTATGVAVQPLWGVLSDYLRAERPILILGAVASALALLAYPAAEGLTAPFLLVAVGTAVYSAARAPIVPITNGLVLSRGYDYGSIRAFGSIAFGIGSLGFGFLVAALGTASIVYFYVGGTAVFVAIVLSVSESPAEGGDADDANGEADPTVDGEADPTVDGEADPTVDGEADPTVDGDAEPTTDGGEPDRSESDTDGTDPSLREAVRTLVTNVDFLVVLVIGFLVGFALRGGSAYFSVYMRAVEASMVVGPWSLSPDAVTGLSWAIKTAFEAAAFVYAVRLSWSYRTFLLFGGVAVAVPNVVYGLTGQPWAIIAVQSASGLGYGLYYVAIVNLVYVVASDRVTSTAQTVLTGAGLGFGGAVGQVAGGELMDLVGVQEMYLYLAVVGFVGAAVALFVRQDGSIGDEKRAV